MSDRAGWQSVDLADALPHPGNEMTVVVSGWLVRIRREDDGILHAYHRRSGREIRCVTRVGMIFVNVAVVGDDLEDHLAGSA